jgi:hypothetical protein
VLGRRPVLFALLTAFAPGFVACKKSNQPLIGSGVGAKRTLELGPFSKLQISGPFDVTLNVGKRQPVELRGDDNLLPHVTAKLEGDRLVIASSRGVKPKQPLRIDLGTEQLQELTVGVAAKARVQGVKAEHFQLRAAGAAEIVAHGSSSSLDVATKSAARIDLSNFSAGSAVVSADDASRIKLGHVEKLKVTQTGLSQVRYRGEPTLEQNVQKPARLVREP